MCYLNREKLIEALKQHRDYVLHAKVSSHTKNIYSMAFSHCIDRIKLETPADVAPVKRGKWIVCGRLEGKTVEKCSACGQGITSKFSPEYHFCPNCGAKMEEET